MPDAVDLVKRIRDVAEETERQAESLALRADRAEERATKAENPAPSSVTEMRENARARRLDAEFLTELAASIELLEPTHEAAFYELARETRP